MNDAKRAAIIEERLGYYRRRLLDNGATPLLCFGLTPEGHAVLCITKDLSKKHVREALRQAIYILDGGKSDA